jgi:hypothetical protein
MRTPYGIKLYRAALAAACLVVFGGAAAQAKDVKIATRNAATGQYVVDESVLKPTFADGTRVEEFAVRRFDASDSWVLVRRGSSAPGQCRTQATPVLARVDGAYLRVDSMPHIVLHCATPTDQFCDSCKYAEALGGWKCVCYRDGAPAGFFCDSSGQIIDNEPFIAEWLLPVP